MLLPVVARLHFVLVNHTLLCQATERTNITKSIKAGRLVMTWLAVYFIPEQNVLIPPPMPFYLFKAVGYLRLHFTLTVLMWYMALLASMKWFLVSQPGEVVAAVLLAWLKKVIHQKHCMLNFISTHSSLSNPGTYITLKCNLSPNSSVKIQVC